MINFNYDGRGSHRPNNIDTSQFLSYIPLNLYISDDGSWDQGKNDQIFSRFTKLFVTKIEIRLFQND